MRKVGKTKVENWKTNRSRYTEAVWNEFLLRKSERSCENEKVGASCTPPSVALVNYGSRRNIETRSLGMVS